MASVEQKVMHSEQGAAQNTAVPSRDIRVVPDGRPVILISQRSEALGDAIVRIPAYRAIRCAFPSHRVISVYRGRSTFSSVFKPLRPLFIDDMIEYWRDSTRTHIGSIARSLGNVDAILDFNSSLETVVNYVVSLGSAPRYVANVVGLALRRGVPWGIEARPAYNSQRYHRLVELIAGRTLPFDAHLPVLPRAQEQTAALLPPGERYLGIVPGRPVAAKKYWPLDRHIALVAQVRKMGLRPVYMLGPFPDEVAQREPLRQAAPEAIFIDQDIAGGDKDYLPWLFHAAAARLTACVGIDGGICHLLATQDIPVATLAGPFVGRAWKPVTQQSWIVDAHSFGSSATKVIPVDAVANVVAEMIAWSDRREAQGLTRH